MVGKLSKQKILDLFFVQVRNMWRVDGLYFLGIEDKFGRGRHMDRRRMLASDVRNRSETSQGDAENKED